MMIDNLPLLWQMSKSKGNVVDPVYLINKYNAESVRYFLMRQGVPHSDNS